jgi:hypothetical protein
MEFLVASATALASEPLFHGGVLGLPQVSVNASAASPVLFTV